MEENKYSKNFIEALKKVYFTEKILFEYLCEANNFVKNKDINSSLGNQCKQTKEQIKRIEEVFRVLGIKSEAEKSKKFLDLIVSNKKKIYTGNANERTILKSALKAEKLQVLAYTALTNSINKIKLANLQNLKELLEKNLEEDQKVTNFYINLNF